MKNHRSQLCMLLVLAMALTFCACGGIGKEERAGVSVSPLETDAAETAFSVESAVPSEPKGITTLLDLTEGRQDCVVLNPEEYANRPHGIQPGTVLNYYTRSFAYSFIPWIERSNDWLWGNIYEGLLYMYMNDPTDIRGCIAESWTHSDDYLTWTFQIREGVRFTDGTVCDAEAVVKCWDFDFGRGRAATDCSIESYEATGPLELVVRLSAPCAWFEVAVCGNPLYVLSPTALELYGREDSRVAVGTGPYRIELFDVPTSDSMKSGDYGGLILKANPDYYLEERMPCIETVNISYIREQGEIMNALLDGNIDGAVLDDVDIFNSLQEIGYDGRLAVCLNQADALCLNAGLEATLELIEVREALCRFLDFDGINEDIYGGLGRVCDSIWAKGTTAYVPTDKFYYNPDEGDALLSSIGLTASDVKLEAVFIVDMSQDRDDEHSIYRGVERALCSAGVEANFSVIDVAPSPGPLWNGKWSIQIGSFAYSNANPFAPWLYIMGDSSFVAPWWKSIFDTEHYGDMGDAYDAMKKAVIWDEMITQCKQLTTSVQNGFGAVGSLQKPIFVALSNDFKNGVFFDIGIPESHVIQLYYLYQ